MKLLRVLFIIFLLGLYSQNSFSQPIRFKTTSVSVANKNEKTGKWRNWTDFKEAKLVISIDGKKNLIVVNSPEIQVFRILEYGEKIENEEASIVPFECRDNFGSKCQILVITKKKEDNRMQFYINYEDVKFVYNIYN
jgi:hypothetical protein